MSHLGLTEIRSTIMVQEAVSMSHVLFTIAVSTGVTAAPYDYVLGAAYENYFH